MTVTREPASAGAAVSEPYVGRSIPRVEDATLLTGRGQFADDLGIRPGTLHAAIVRSPYPHAEIIEIDYRAALALDGIATVLTGSDVKAWAAPFMVGVKQPMEHWCVAIDRVRYVGEPVAIVIARDRYLAEDAAELIRVDYRPLPAVIDPERAGDRDAPVLHPAVGSNVVSERRFRYGDPDAAFKSAARVVDLTVHYPRNSCTPIEGYVVVADYNPAEDSYDVLSNFQGPFALHPVMALALKVPANRLRLRTPPDSGGSFGVKQGVFPYIVALALAARKAGRPVKWVEDRLEHLTAATAATNRVIRIEAAVSADGEILGLRYDQIEDCGGYLRAPEPATIYRMHGNMTGAYKVRHLEIINRIVLTNKTPTGLVRGFGGPQVYFALERLMHKVARTMGLDPIDVLRRNLLPADVFPYRAPAGAQLDSGDYPAAVELGVDKGGLRDLYARRTQARAEGRLYGVGLAAVVEPSVSNMGYITTVLTAAERHKAGLKGGAVATATVGVDPLGSVTVHAASVPQGQGHRTVLAQVVADVLGLRPQDIKVNVELDTQKDAWSVASGNYSSRFAAAVAGTAHIAAMRLRDKLARIAALQMNASGDQIKFAGGKIFAAGNPANALPFHRIAGISHWAKGTMPDGVDPALRETAFWSPPQLTPPTDADEINSSAAHGFVFDFCGVEVDQSTGRVRIDRYVTVHDAGRILHPALADGQIRGSFAHGIGAALFEELAYSPDGSFLSGTFADYPIPTACEIPDPLILHVCSPSPVTPLGAKGLGEGNCMSTPVCIANAVADALGIEDIRLPLTPPRVAALIHGREPAARRPAEIGVPKLAGYALTGTGAAIVAAPPERAWKMLLDPAVLTRAIPGCRRLERVEENKYVGEVSMGVGPVRGTFSVTVELSDLTPPRSLRLSGGASAPIGASRGEARIELRSASGGTEIAYTYGADLSGKLAAVGGRMLDGATRVMIGQFFRRLAGVVEGKPDVARPWWRKLLAWLGGKS